MIPHSKLMISIIYGTHDLPVIEFKIDMLLTTDLNKTHKLMQID